MEKVVGRIPVLECLRSKRRRAYKLYILRGGEGLDSVLHAAQNIPVEQCSRSDLDRLAQGNLHQGVVLEADSLAIFKAERWIERTHPADAVIVALDGIEDPHNFGAIVRSAAAFGAHGVLFGKDRAAPVSPAAAKSAAGAMECIDLVQAVNLVRALELLKEAGYWVAGFDAEASQALWDADLKGRIVLVIGSEGKGMRRLVRDHCDLYLRIPMHGAVSSLNASVSAAIALAECARQRTAK